jgi:hypothetical protein
LVTNELPTLCKQNMELMLASTQSYIHVDNSHLVSLFSPFNDSVTIRCHISQGLTVQNLPLTVGLNQFLLEPGCEAQSRHLLMFPETVVINNGTKLKNYWSLNLTSQLLDLSEDLTDLHKINITNLAPHLIAYTSNVQSEKLDLADAAKTVTHIQAIHGISSFNPIKPDLETATPISWTVQGLSVIVIILVILACCNCGRSCCCPDIACCSNIVVAAKFVGLGIFKIIRFLICACHGKKPHVQAVNTASPTYWRASDPTPTSEDPLSENWVNRSPEYEPVVLRAPNWEICRLGRRVILKADLPSGPIFYNHLLGVIENEEGNRLNMPVGPSPDLLNRYLKAINSSSPPDVTYKQGRRHLIDDPYVIFDKEHQRYYHRVTNKPVCGYRLPRV